MTRQGRHTAPWSSLNDAWRGRNPAAGVQHHQFEGPPPKPRTPGLHAGPLPHLMGSSSRRFEACTEWGSGLEDGPEDVYASSREGDDGLEVPFPLALLAV